MNITPKEVNQQEARGASKQLRQMCPPLASNHSSQPDPVLREDSRAAAAKSEAQVSHWGAVKSDFQMRRCQCPEEGAPDRSHETTSKHHFFREAAAFSWASPKQQSRPFLRMGGFLNTSTMNGSYGKQNLSEHKKRLPGINDIWDRNGFSHRALPARVFRVSSNTYHWGVGVGFVS